MGKPCAFAGQSLLSHMKGVERLVRENFIAQGYSKALRKRFPIPVDEKTAEEAVILSAVSHDLGKSVESFQRNFRDDCSPIGKASFHPHEILSGAYLLKSLRNSHDLLPYILMAVIMHHHAMRTPEPKTFSDAKGRAKGGGRIVGYKELHSFLSKLESFNLREVQEITPDDVNELERFINSIKANSPGRFSNSVAASFSRTSPQMYLLFLLPLVVSDNLDSTRRSDNEDRRTFIKELKYIYGD